MRGMTPVIHWFRRDLRLVDNTALLAAAARNQPVIAVYILSKWTRSHRFTGAKRQRFLCGSLLSLEANLNAHGTRLIVREGDAVEALLQLAREVDARQIFFNRDPDPFGRSVEKCLASEASSLGIVAEGYHDVTIHAPQDVLTGNGQQYRIFTPYMRAWRHLPKPSPGGIARLQPFETELPSLPIPTIAHWGLNVEGDIVEWGERAARQRLKRFLKDQIGEYAESRDLPAVEGTSRLSQDLRFGLLSVREIFSECQRALAEPSLSAVARKGIETFVNELIWREFYMAILAHNPQVLEQEFNPKLRRMVWRDDPEGLDRWHQGVTGFPFVDAGMRQLRATGFMHNRLRMVTAMFLTKDLLIDWRHGEQIFMQHLVDGEIASNNGGWQWSAGTGADAAPYFRIQNPWTQGARFDPSGEYIRRWVPELGDVPTANLHRPPTNGRRLHRSYPMPIVDHGEARHRCLEHFKQAQPAPTK